MKKLSIIPERRSPYEYSDVMLAISEFMVQVRLKINVPRGNVVSMEPAIDVIVN